MEKIITTKNPFATNLVLKVAEEAEVSKPDSKVEKKPKTVDLVKAHLACIPSLEKAKEDLTEVLTSLADEKLKDAVSNWISEIEKIEENVLSVTMQGIKQKSLERTQVAFQGAITPGMFSADMSEPAPEAKAAPAAE
jgi:hypothetical protein